MSNKDTPPRKLNRRALVLGAAVGVGSLVAIPATLHLVGFTSVGVAAGSIAAAIQTPVTAAGSIFAGCQSAGVLGLAGSTQAAIAATSGGAAYIGYRKLYRRRKQLPKPINDGTTDDNNKTGSKP